MSLKLFKSKNFTLYSAGKFVSLLGSNMLQFALSLYVLSVTGSATIFASILSILIIPRLLLSPIAGVFGDWFDRKKSIVFLDFLNAFIIAFFSIIYFVNGSISIPLLYVFVILLEITEIFFHSSIAGILPSIVDKEDLMHANATNSLINNIGQLLAPIIASIIYGYFGMQAILYLCVVSFFLSAVSELFLIVPKTHVTPEHIDLKQFKFDLYEGIKIIKENKFISSIIGIATIVNFCVGPLFSIGLIFVLKEVLKTTDYQYALFQTILSLSMILTPIFLSSMIKKIPIGKLSFLSLFSIAILTIFMSIGPSGILSFGSDSNLIPFIYILLISFLVGISATSINIATGTLFSQIVPIEMMGRTSTVFNLVVTIFIPIGQMIFGLLYDIIPSSFVILSSGLILFVSVLCYKKILYQMDDAKQGSDDTLEEEKLVCDNITLDDAI